MITVSPVGSLIAALKAAGGPTISRAPGPAFSAARARVGESGGWATRGHGVRDDGDIAPEDDKV